MYYHIYYIYVTIVNSSSFIRCSCQIQGWFIKLQSLCLSIRHNFFISSTLVFLSNTKGLGITATHFSSICTRKIHMDFPTITICKAISICAYIKQQFELFYLTVS